MSRKAHISFKLKNTKKTWKLNFVHELKPENKNVTMKAINGVTATLRVKKVDKIILL